MTQLSLPIQMHLLISVVRVFEGVRLFMYIFWDTTHRMVVFAAATLPCQPRQ